MDVVYALRRQGIRLYGAEPAGAWGALDDGCGAGQKQRVRATNAHRREHERLKAAARRAGQPTPPPPDFGPFMQRVGCDVSASAYKLVLICNSGQEPGLTRTALRELGSQRIFLDAAMSPPTIYTYLRLGFRIVRTPAPGQRTRARWLRAPALSTEEALGVLGYTSADLPDGFDADDHKMLLAAFLTKIYLRAGGLGERGTLAKLRVWPRAATRAKYLEILRGNNEAWTGAFLASATAAGLLAAEPADAIANDPNHYEFYFSSTLTLRYDAPHATEVTAPVSVTSSHNGLPAPLTLASLRDCGGAMRDEVDADAEESDSGIRQELRTVHEYARRRGTRVHAAQAPGGFYVAVGL